MAYKVAIDCGHGLYTGGKQSCKLTEDLYIDGKLVRSKGQVIKENEFNRLVGTALGNALKRCGFEVKYVSDMTGKTDTSLANRVVTANSWGADIFISCHYNAIGSCSTWQTKCKGLLVLKHYNCSSKTNTLCTKIHEAIKGNYSHTYGVGTDQRWSGFSLYVLKHTNMPATLIEFGFMDYKEEAMKMLDPAWYNKLGEDTCRGICNYFGVTYKATSSFNNTTNTTNGVYKVIVDELNIRQGAGTKYPIVGTVKKGEAYTIVEINGSWGRLKSNVGWININPKYCTKIR